LDIAVLVELRFLDKVHVGEKANQSDKTADEDTQVCETTSLLIQNKLVQAPKKI